MKTMFSHECLEEPIEIDYEWKICPECKGEGKTVYEFFSSDIVGCLNCEASGKYKHLHLPKAVIASLESYYDEAASSRKYARQERAACGGY